MVVLNIGHLFCYTGTVYITAWWMDAAGDPAGVAAAERGLHPRRPLRARGQHQVQARGLPRPRPRPRAQQRTEPPQCRGQDRPRRGQRHSGAASSLAHTGLGPRPQAPGQLWKQQPAGCMCWLFRARPPGCARVGTCTTRAPWWVWRACARTATTCTARWTSTTSAPATASPRPSSWSAPSPSSSTNLPPTASSSYCQ